MCGTDGAHDTQHRYETTADASADTDNAIIPHIKPIGMLAHMSFVPFASAAVLSASEIWANLVKTALTLPPFSIEMMRQWSSSFTQHSAVLDSLWKIPRSCEMTKTHGNDPWAPMNGRGCS